ncbi:phosphoserine phosphatase SerB [Fibrobacterales bacterium]|nr:phosphoserine phosphatase SerB [Fibrobacterales bacterium]
MSDINILNLVLTGTDEPGITSRLMGVLQTFDVEILDISQSVIHDVLTLSVIIKFPENQGTSNILKDLLFEAHEMNVSVRFEPLKLEEYQEWVEAQKDTGFIVTILGQKILPADLFKITRVLSNHKLNILDLTRLSARPNLHSESTQACVEILVKGGVKDLAKLRDEFMTISFNQGIDIALQINNVFRRNRRLVAFDMDSTLIQTEVIDELGIKAGVGEEIAAITEAAMRGEIDFNESLRQRVSKLKGLPESVLQEIAESLPITPGAEILISTLKTFGYKVAILSGGFTYFGNYLKEKFGVDYVHANELEIIDGKLTGKVIGEIVNGEMKAEHLKRLCKLENISTGQTIAVGDGANDLPMLATAGLGIAFNAKPIVRKNAKAAMNGLGLDAVLYFIGFRDREINSIPI